MRVRHVLAALSSLVLGAVAAQAATLENQQIGSWLVGAYSNDQTGKFSHCAMSAGYQSGTYMVFSVNTGFAWSMGFANQAWTLTPGASYDLAYSIDGAAPNAARAAALSNSVVEIPMANSSALFQKFRRGYQLTVTAAGQVFYFNLTGTAAGLTAVLQCVQRRVFQAQQPLTTNPFVASTGSTPSTGNVHSAAIRAEAVALVANILSAAGISGFHIMQPNEVPKDYVGFDVVWNAPGVIGIEMTVLPETGVAIDSIPAFVISAFAKDCKGRFLSGSIPDDVNPSLSVQRVFTKCDTGSVNASSYFAILPRKSGGAYLFGEIGGGTSAQGNQGDNDTSEAPREAEGKIRKAAFTVLQK